MKKFNRGSRFNNRDSDSRFNNRDSGRSQMHKAVCANCGQDCEVPFRPSGDRPVYCSNCFKSIGGPSQHRPEGGDFRRPNSDKKIMFKAVCDNCGRGCEVPFQPSAGKPVYCNNCFGKSDGGGSKKPDQHKEHFDTLNAKLDKILNLLARPVIEETSKKEQTASLKPESKKSATKNAAIKKSKAKKKK